MQRKLKILIILMSPTDNNGSSPSLRAKANPLPSVHPILGPRIWERWGVRQPPSCDFLILISDEIKVISW